MNDCCGLNQYRPAINREDSVDQKAIARSHDARTIPSQEPRPIKSRKPVDGTPLHFKEIFIGRCWQYQMKIGLKDTEQINCEKVWENFEQAFSFKGPCDVTTKDYLVFLDKIEEDIPKDKVTKKYFYPFYFNSVETNH